MKRIVVFVLVMMLALSAVSCSCGKKAQEKKAEEEAEEMAEELLEALGSDVDVDVDIDGEESLSIKTEDGEMVIEASEHQKWPSEMPSDVPEIKGVNIIGYFNMSGAQSVTFIDCKEKTAMGYKSLIEKAGYAIVMEMDSDGEYMIMSEKDGAAINFTWSADSGEGSITYMGAE